MIITHGFDERLLLRTVIARKSEISCGVKTATLPEAEVVESEEVEL